MSSHKVGSLGILCIFLSFIFIPISVVGFVLLVWAFTNSDDKKDRSSLMFIIQGALAFGLFSLAGIGIHEMHIVPTPNESKGVKAAFILLGIFIYVLFTIIGSISYWMNSRK